MAVPFYRVTRAVLVLALLPMFLADATAADGGAPGRRGKVVIIRGAFTVFSLGMNDLGDKLREHGLDVEVVADISASRATARIREEYRRARDYGPIVFIGHSRGAELAPKQARALQPYRIPVKLVVMVDAVHAATIPGNVERCLNLYHSNILIMPHGVPASAESRRTQLVNTNIDLLPARDHGGSINHFNIDSSDWVHDLVITEVLRACGLAGPAPAAPVAKAPPSRRPAAAPPQPTAPIAAPWQPKSGLRFPASVTGDESDGDIADPQLELTAPLPPSAGNPAPQGDRPGYRSNSRSRDQSPSARVRIGRRAAAARSQPPAADSRPSPAPRPATRPEPGTDQPESGSATRLSDAIKS